ncbi:protealysin inhibitor emfourin [Marmoricola sp. URHB0036]|uniref:protealysin inhibitor emfourin n=1 Tax=Marmoricola sp. URHB0036 TaxID=1298863 RepID=UPI000429DD63|nr:protealysin inhibitor emfourin [Marmoricola sp. URHB0036]
MRCHFIPGYLLERLAQAPDEDLAACGRRTQVIDEQLRARPTVAPAAAGSGAWEIHDAANGSTLPGRLVRAAGQPDSGDVTVDEAATGITESLALFSDFGRSSYDDRGATVVATVHYEQDYDNAFWDGTQLVFGDGDGRVFDRFTKPIDVLGHELSHAVTQFTADLTYQGQSGALNESMSDVFGACIKQRHLGQDAAGADWLVGEGIFLPGIKGRALRSMSDPGTAYDDPQIGQDPQVGSMADYVDTTDDNGGVHLNSGIPNRAFVLAARAIGGESWSGAGRIWYAALTSGLSADSDFATFAAATVSAAGEHSGAVQDAWDTVGVTGAGSSTGGPTPTPSPGLVVQVTRSGGFAGMTKEGAVDLDSTDPRAPAVRRLVQRIDFRAVGGDEPRPDRYVYRFSYLSIQTLVHEHQLTEDLRELARLVLGE